jgi:circadian clock protein KaiC
MTASLEPWATGVPGLDLLLGGGLSGSPLVTVIGPTGAGKTVLACHLLFQAVQQGMRGLILTAYAEDHSKLLQHLRPFTFFSEPAVGDTVTLVSLAGRLGTTTETAASAIVQSIRESRARFVVLDGFQGIADHLNHGADLRRLLATVASQISYLNVTLLLTLTGTARDEPSTTGLTSADVVLDLHYRLEGQRHSRRLEVLKHRGRAHLPGTHSYAITDHGVTVIPQLEERTPPAVQLRPTGRVPFQVPELDQLLGGGLTAGTTTLMVGAPGVGKTMLGLTWALAGPEPAGRSVFLSFDERLPEMHAKAAFLRLPLAAALEAGTCTFLSLNPVHLNPDAVADAVLAALTPTTRRVVLDNVGVLVQTLGRRAPDYLAALVNHMYAAGVTTLLLVEIKPFTGLQFDVTETPLSILADNIVIVQQVAAQGILRRVVAVLKMRFSAYDATLRELVIDSGGVRVLTALQSDAGVLAAAAEVSGLMAPPTVSPTPTNDTG